MCVGIRQMLKYDSEIFCTLTADKMLRNYMW